MTENLRVMIQKNASFTVSNVARVFGIHYDDDDCDNMLYLLIESNRYNVEIYVHGLIVGSASNLELNRKKEAMGLYNGWFEKNRTHLKYIFACHFRIFRRSFTNAVLRHHRMKGLKDCRSSSQQRIWFARNFLGLWKWVQTAVCLYCHELSGNIFATTSSIPSNTNFRDHQIGAKKLSTAKGLEGIKVALVKRYFKMAMLGAFNGIEEVTMIDIAINLCLTRRRLSSAYLRHTCMYSLMIGSLL